MRSETVDFGAVRCERFVTAGPRSLVPHEHDTIHACFVRQGSMAEGTDAESLLSAGSGRVSPAGDAHRIRVGDRGLDCLVLHIAPVLADAAGAVVPREPIFLSDRRVESIGCALAGEMLAGSRDDVSPLALESLALEVLAWAREAGRAKPVPPPWLVRTRERLRDQLESPPTLETLARDAGVSRAHLARAYRQRFGRTVGDDLRALRIERARRLLLESDLPLASVAFRAGFADQSHMTRQVGRRLGTSPGRLRQNTRAG